MLCLLSWQHHSSDKILFSLFWFLLTLYVCILICQSCYFGKLSHSATFLQLYGHLKCIGRAELFKVFALPATSHPVLSEFCCDDLVSKDQISFLAIFLTWFPLAILPPAPCSTSSPLIEMRHRVFTQVLGCTQIIFNLCPFCIVTPFSPV